MLLVMNKLNINKYKYLHVNKTYINTFNTLLKGSTTYDKN